MPNRAQIHPNALKHGVFAEIMILPSEDAQEFAKLHAALVEEWRPVGPTEKDAVFSIAKGMWRKRRMQSFLSSELQRCRIDPDHAAYDEVHALRSYCEILKFAPNEFRFAQGLLSDENFDHLKRKFPRENFQSDSEWFGAIQSEVTSVLLPEAERSVDSAEVLVARDAAFFSQEVVKNELAVDERIDAMIDRAVKRLVQAKAVKQMLGTTSPNERSVQPKKLPSNKPVRSAKVATKKQNDGRSDSTREAAGTQKNDS